MAQPYGANREQDDQLFLQQMMGGAAPVNTTMPVGAPMPADGPAAMPPPDGPAAGGGMGTREDRDRLTWGNAGSMSGFQVGSDYGGDTKARNSVKNTFGRIASRYKNAPSQLDAIMADPEFQRYFPNASRVQGGAGDKIDFGGVLSDFESGTPVGVVDVLQSADPNADTAENWVWLPDGEGGGQMVPAGGGGDIMSMLMGGGQQGPSLDQLGQSDALAQILAALEQQGGGQQDPRAQELLQSLLG